ncbi:hypothetical protein HHK36_023364 [Tetracentron sinense]|uniref:Tify domain-containing protein n=1 Tax=Tetracentron sinense TaxID=13715 RepID=A0A834YL59_TETSI|nr:hypothetical protein HHK36_023364 [Tetracentron sinense]
MVLPLSLRRNTKLDLCLRPSAFLPANFSGTGTGTGTGTGNMKNGSTESPQQQLTIFHNGRVCVCDVTELQSNRTVITNLEFGYAMQARAILWVASGEMDERMSTPRSELISPSLQSPVSSLSMKRSLQRFLQKRKIRIQATSPY